MFVFNKIISKVQALLTVLSPLLLLGCVSVEQPKEVGIYAGILSAEPLKSEYRVVSGGSDKGVGVVLSENTRKNIEYLKEYREKLEQGSSFAVFDGGQTQQAAIDLTDPSFSVKWVAGSLKKRFGRISILDRLDQKTVQRYDAVMVVDLITLLKPNCVESKMKIAILDTKLGLVGDAVGADEYCTGLLSLAPPVVEFAKFQKSKIRALEKLDIEFDKLVVVSKAATQTTVPRDGAPTSGDAREFEKCMERAVAVKDSRVQMQAMTACDQLR